MAADDFRFSGYFFSKVQLGAIRRNLPQLNEDEGDLMKAVRPEEEHLPFRD